MVQWKLNVKAAPYLNFHESSYFLIYSSIIASFSLNSLNGIPIFKISLQSLKRKYQDL